MNQVIDPIKLKVAAEHLEWVLKQYPDSDDVQGLLTYIPYKEPDVEAAYYEFAAQMRGGRSEQEKRIMAQIKAMTPKAEP